MKKPPDYLKRYAGTYRLYQGEHGIWNLLKRHKERDGIRYDVYDYSDTHLAACLPPRTGLNLLERLPDVFTLHQDADDAIVLLFAEEHLHDLADVLKLRKRRRLSEKQCRETAERLRQFQFTSARMSEKSTQKQTILTVCG